MKTKLLRALAAVGGVGLVASASVAAAATAPESDWRRPWGLNLPQGVTELSQEVYSLHMLVFWIVCIIGVGVFAGIFYSVWKFRKSQGAVPAKWHHSTTVEVVWTVIPFLILLFIAVPATQTMIKIDDTSDYDMTVKVTGYQWMWEYEYLDEDISFLSRLDQDSDRARQRNPDISPRDVEHYLLNVDNPLVVPTNTRIRFLLTANDVIHAWWVPELGWKKDAIPGFINEAWAEIQEPGTYRGQCAELCGRDHGFMPIVVVALEQEEYDEWLEGQRAENGVVAEDEAEEAEVETAALEDVDHDELMQIGQGVYGNQCIACHQAEGQGMATFPALAGNDRVMEDAEWVTDVLVNGVSGTAMTAYGPRLDDRELAGVLTYIRNAWGNEADAIQPADVRDAR